MTRDASMVRRLGDEDIHAATDVICESFFDYPVMRFVLGASG